MLLDVTIPTVRFGQLIVLVIYYNYLCDLQYILYHAQWKYDSRLVKACPGE